jgi:hypothetical protein
MQASVEDLARSRGLRGQNGVKFEADGKENMVRESPEHRPMHRGVFAPSKHQVQLLRLYMNRRILQALFKESTLSSLLRRMIFSYDL